MKHIYRLTRRHGTWMAGAEIGLTADEATRIENESPGVLDGPHGAAPTNKVAPKVKPDADKEPAANAEL